MKFRDLLSMQSGHGVCALADMLNGDPVDNFLHAPFLYRPGTTFVYSTGATCVCAATVEKRTGKKLVDFLDERLFSPLGIAKPFWKSIGGVTLGGVGLYLSLDDIVPFADMLLAGGTYGGRRIVSEEWLKKATRAHSVDRNNGSHDWVAGYGYQFWMNDGVKGFRGDGAYGQLCIVVPERGITFVMLAEAANMQKEMDLITEFVNNDDAPGSADLSALADIYSPRRQRTPALNVRTNATTTRPGSPRFRFPATGTSLSSPRPMPTAPRASGQVTDIMRIRII